MAKPKKTSSTVTVDQRKKNDRRGPDRRTGNVAVPAERRAVGERRAKVARRRQIDPTTCERDYTDEEVEFMHALEQYKRKNGRMFPTCSEVLEVLRSLGYEKHARCGQPSVDHPAAESCRSDNPTDEITLLPGLDD